MGLVVIGAACVATAAVLVFWSFAGQKAAAIGVSHNLSSGFRSITDMRQALLQHSAQDRIVGPAVEKLSREVRRFTPAGMIERLERRVLLAGTPAGWTMDRVLAAKLVLGAAGALVGLLRLVLSTTPLNMAVAAALTGLGYFLPDLLLYNQALKRQQQIRIELPDTIDQITISVEAGLGLDAAMARAARSGSGAFARELARTLQDVRAGIPRDTALRSLVARTDVAELRHFVMALLQAEAYGVPVAQVLRIQSAEMRVKRRQAAEERAMKLPVKVLFPLVVFILPTLFIVLLGPAAIRISQTLGGVHR